MRYEERGVYRLWDRVKLKRPGGYQKPYGRVIGICEDYGFEMVTVLFENGDPRPFNKACLGVDAVEITTEDGDEQIPIRFKRGDIVYIFPVTADDQVAVELTGKRFRVEDWKRAANGDIFCTCSNTENGHKIVFRQCDLLKDTREKTNDT